MQSQSTDGERDGVPQIVHKNTNKNANSVIFRVKNVVKSYFYSRQVVLCNFTSSIFVIEALSILMS